MKSYSKETGNVVVLTEYLDAGLSRKSYPGWIRIHFPKQYAENPKIASIKTKFECSGKDMLIAIQKSQAYHVSKEKRAAWLTAASKTLNTPIEIPLYSEVNSKLAKNLFQALNISIDLHHNISGLNLETRTNFQQQMERRIQESCFSLLNDMGMNLPGFLEKQAYITEEFAAALFGRKGLFIRKSFDQNNFALNGITPFKSPRSNDDTGIYLETWAVLFVLVNELWK